jgi:3-oxosteroid 1-dehydrogenase
MADQDQVHWDHTTDLLLIGSGAGLAGALRAGALGRQVLVVEKSDKVGGSTGMSGGVLWLPDNPLMRREGVADSLDQALAYFETVVGDAGPASSPARRITYVQAGNRMITFLEGEGLRFRRCEGYSDYYAGVAGNRGGVARGRSIEPVAYDSHRLGAWAGRLRPSIAGGLTLYTGEAAALSTLKTWRGVRTVFRVGARTVLGRLRRKAYITNGAALIGQLLGALVARGVPVWTESALEDLIVEDGRVVGAVIRKDGRAVRVRARDGVLIAAGGFARNPQMREQFSGKQPNRAEWTSSNPGDTGEALQIAMAHNAATDMMDEAWWIPSWIKPDGTPAMCIGERHKPGSIVVDAEGNRFMNEAVAYQECGQLMYAHDQAVGGAMPCWLVLDSRHRSQYLFGGSPPGRTPAEWLASGQLKKADTLAELAALCGINPEGLAKTVERFNRFADAGVDEDFQRGVGSHEQYQGDRAHKPNACLERVARAPFYAVALYPGDVGTSGGLLCDEHSRVLDVDGRPIPGLYATGNSTASVMGRKYLGAGASIGASAVFAYVAAEHAAARSVATAGQ